MATTIPYSVRIPRELLDEMRRQYDRMEPPKPTFSAILTHIVKLGWDHYRTQTQSGSNLQRIVLPSYPKRDQNQSYSR